jgi:DNA-binding NarL/FixJ family response regulator
MKPPAAHSSKRVWKCVLVEDQVMFLELLASLLQLRGGLRIVAKALTVEAGIHACTKHSPDILILDLELPDGDGLEVAKHLVNINPEAKILIITGHSSTFFCPARLRKFVHAVVDKTQSYEALRFELDGLLAAFAMTLILSSKKGMSVWTEPSRSHFGALAFQEWKTYWVAHRPPTPRHRVICIF